MEIHPAITFSAFGAILFYLIWGLSLASKTRKWPKTVGSLSTAEIDEPRGKIRVVGKKVFYSFVVDGKKYIGNRIYAPIADNLFVYIIWFNSSKYLDRYFKNLQTVEVYYNPKKPSQNCLRPRGEIYVLLESAIWFAILLSLYMLVILR